MVKLFFVLFPMLGFSQTIITKDSIALTIKLKVDSIILLKKDKIYFSGKRRVRIHKDSIYFYDQNQYLKWKKN